MTKKESALAKEWQSVGGRDCSGWAPKVRGGWKQCDPKTIPKGANMEYDSFKVDKFKYTKAFKKLGGKRYREIALSLLKRAEVFEKAKKGSMKAWGSTHGPRVAEYENYWDSGVEIAKRSFGFTNEEINAIHKIAKGRVYHKGTPWWEKNPEDWDDEDFSGNLPKD